MSIRRQQNIAVLAVTLAAIAAGCSQVAEIEAEIASNRQALVASDGGVEDAGRHTGVVNDENSSSNGEVVSGDSVFLYDKNLMSHVPKDVLDAAQTGFKELLEYYRPKLKQIMGIKRDVDIDSVRVGLPYEMQKLVRNEVGDESNIGIVPVYSWMFPIVFNGDARMLFKIGLRNDEWKMVAFGYSQGARRFKNTEIDIGITGQVKRRVLLVDYQMDKDYLAFSGQEEDIEDSDIYVAQGRFSSTNQPIDLEELKEQLQEAEGSRP